MTAPRTETFVVVQEMGDLHERYDNLREQWDTLTDEEADTPEGRKVGIAAAEAKAALEAETIRGTFTKLSFADWEELKADYPPDADNPDASGWALFSSPFWHDAFRKCWSDCDLDDKEFEAVWERLPRGDRQRLSLQIQLLNEAPLSIPLPRRPLPATTSPGSGSKRRRASA